MIRNRFERDGEFPDSPVQVLHLTIARSAANSVQESRGNTGYTATLDRLGLVIVSQLGICFSERSWFIAELR